MNRRVGLAIAGAASIAGLFVTLPLDARQVDVSALDRIKDEGMNRSQVMTIASYLTDVYGPRLTGYGRCTYRHCALRSRDQR